MFVKYFRSRTVFNCWALVASLPISWVSVRMMRLPVCTCTQCRWSKWIREEEVRMFGHSAYASLCFSRFHSPPIHTYTPLSPLTSFHTSSSPFSNGTLYIQNTPFDDTSADAPFPTLTLPLLCLPFFSTAHPPLNPPFTRSRCTSICMCT